MYYNISQFICLQKVVKTETEALFLPDYSFSIRHGRGRCLVHPPVMEFILHFNFNISPLRINSICGDSGACTGEKCIGHPDFIVIIYASRDSGCGTGSFLRWLLFIWSFVETDLVAAVSVESIHQNWYLWVIFIQAAF